MYKTITSASSTWVDSADVEPGLISIGKVPVLCCPVAAAGIASSVLGAVGETVADNDSSSADTAVLQTTYAIAYITPGRIAPSDVAVRDDASVEDLLSAVLSRA